MGNAFIINPVLSRLDIIDAINERLMKARSLTSLLVNSNFSGDIGSETIFGYVLVLDGCLEEVDTLFTQLDKATTIIRK